MGWAWGMSIVIVNGISLFLRGSLFMHCIFLQFVSCGKKGKSIFKVNHNKKCRLLVEFEFFLFFFY